MKAPALRRPAVAGRFYPAKPEVLSQQVDRFLAAQQTASEQLKGALGCVVPHAGYMYSGPVAGAVFGLLPACSTYIMLCPNHTGRGAPQAIMTQGEWLTPLGTVQIDSALGSALCRACHLLMEDSRAHEDEHALEVQLPFLQRRAGTFRFVPIALGVGGLEALEALGRGIAQTLKSSSTPALIVASSDMNHYEPDDVTRRKDALAIERIKALDAQGLYAVIRREDISMCGYGPAIAMLTAAKELGATRGQLIRYATSADASGDRSTVVGYAGIIVS